MKGLYNKDRKTIIVIGVIVSALALIVAFYLNTNLLDNTIMAGIFTAISIFFTISLSVVSTLYKTETAVKYYKTEDEETDTKQTKLQTVKSYLSLSNFLSGISIILIIASSIINQLLSKEEIVIKLENISTKVNFAELLQGVNIVLNSLIIPLIMAVIYIAVKLFKLLLSLLESEAKLEIKNNLDKETTNEDKV
jgi:hypothetical protein